MFEIEINRYTPGFYVFYYQSNLLIILMYLYLFFYTLLLIFFKEFFMLSTYRAQHVGKVFTTQWQYTVCVYMTIYDYPTDFMNPICGWIFFLFF